MKHLSSYFWNLFYHTQRKSLDNIFIKENDRLIKKFCHHWDKKRRNNIQHNQPILYYAK